MDSELLGCPICLEFFDKSDRAPRMIPLCGHTICTECLSTVLSNKKEARCPLDKKAFSFQQLNLDAFPVNLIVIQLIEEKLNKKFCQEHNGEVTFLCLADGCRMCDDCVWKGEHQGHKVKPLKVIRAQVNKNRREIEGALEDVKEFEKKLEEDLKEIKKNILKKIKDKFDIIENLLKKKQLDMNIEIDSLFYMEKLRILERIEKDGLVKKASDLNNIFKNEELMRDEGFFKDMQDTINQFKERSDPNKLEKDIERFKQVIEETSQLAETWLDNQKVLWSQFDFSFKNNLETNREELLSSEEIPGQQPRPDIKKCPLTVLTNISFKHSGNNLEITDTDRSKEVRIELEKWQNVENVKLDIKKSTIETQDIQTLCYVWSRIKGSSTLKVRFSPGTITDKIGYVLNEGPTTFSILDIDLEGYKISEQSEIAPLISKMIKRMDNLNQIWLRFNKSKICKQDIEIIFNEGLCKKPELKNFAMFLDQTGLTDDDVQALSVPLPNIKSFTICLNKSGVTDKVANLFIRETLYSMKSLEELQLFLHRTKLTDSSMQNMFIDLKNLKKLSVDLGFTAITDKTIEALASAMGNLAETLETFQIGFASTQVSDASICQLFTKMPKAKFLTLGLSLTNITDKALEVFVEKTLVHANSLEHLNMWVNKTKVTDVGLQQVFKNVPDVKILAMDLDTTKVTSQSIEFLVREKLPTFQNITELKMDLSNTAVSSTLKAEVTKFAKTLSEQKNKS